MKESALGILAKIVSGGTPSRSVNRYWGGTIPWIKTGSINYSTITEANEWITEDGLNESSARVLNAGTILMAMYGQGKTRGQVAILGIDAAINQACAGILLDERTDRDYVFQQLWFRYRQIRDSSNTGNQENLNAGLIRGIRFPLPNVCQQRKIAKILGTWDRAIETTRKLIEAKTLRKRGLMQKLLGGEARFAEFSDSDWRSVQMNKLLKQIQRPIEWAPDKLLSLVSVRRRSGGLFRREVLRGDQYKTKDLHELKTDDFLISKRQVSHGALAVVQADFEGTHVSKEYSIFINRDANTLYMPFIDWLSRTRRMWHRAFVASNGVVLEKLIFVPKDFLRAEIRIPSNVEEQRRIAEVLDACDREIAILTKKLDAFREQKRGLMQRLLTGEIEVNIDQEEVS